MTTNKLPPLPAPYSEKAALGGFPAAAYTADQMRSYGAACAAAALEAAYPLPDSLYPGSKDWLAADYAGRVEWLHMMYESKSKEVELWAQACAAKPAAVPNLLGLLKEARATLEMWKDVAPAVSLCADIDKAIAASKGNT